MLTAQLGVKPFADHQNDLNNRVECIALGTRIITFGTLLFLLLFNGSETVCMVLAIMILAVNIRCAGVMFWCIVVEVIQKKAGLTRSKIKDILKPNRPETMVQKA